MKTAVATLQDESRWAIGRPFPKIELVDLGDGNGATTRRTVDIAGTKIVRIDLVGENVEIWGLVEGDPKNGLKITHYPPCVSVVTSIAEEREWRELVSFHGENPDAVQEVCDMQQRVWTLDGDVPGSNGELMIVCMARVQEDVDPGNEEDEEEEEDDEVVETGAVEVFARTKPGKEPEFIHFLLMPFSVLRVASKLPIDVWLQAQRDLDGEPVATVPAPQVAPGPPAGVPAEAAPPPQAVNGLAGAHVPAQADPLAGEATS